MRHPYLQDEAFTPEIEAEQVSTLALTMILTNFCFQITVAVFDRAISKFKDVLLVEDLQEDLLRDALKTLNEIVFHQETADKMIEEGILEIVPSLLKNPNQQVQEESA